MALTHYRHNPQQVGTALHEAGVVVRAPLHRDPEGIKKTPQAVLLAQRRG